MCGMKFDIITAFPNILDSYTNESILKRAQEVSLISIKTHDIRDYSEDKHNKIDDTPYGGGPGMVLKAGPINRAVKAAKTENNSRIILMSLRGKKFDQKEAHRLVKYNQLIFICGRYEGVDERVARYVADEEMSIGDFVLSGGELPAAVITEGVARLIPGVLGKTESLEEIKGTYPVYTKPEVEKINGEDRKVPEVLLSGDHKKIDEWRNSF